MFEKEDRTEIFQSTPSLRKATGRCQEEERNEHISIHTFLAEGDAVTFNVSGATADFNPHLPCGRRPKEFSKMLERLYFNPHLPCGRRLSDSYSFPFHAKFQSTPSLRKATRYSIRVPYDQNISIHTFLAEGDLLTVY